MTDLRCTRPDCWAAGSEHGHLSMPDPEGTTRLDLIREALTGTSDDGKVEA